MTWVDVGQMELLGAAVRILEDRAGSWQPVKCGEAFSEWAGTFSGVVSLVSQLPNS